MKDKMNGAQAFFKTLVEGGKVKTQNFSNFEKTLTWVIISNSAYNCGANLTSDIALLNVRMRMVIPNRRITHRVNKN